MILNVTYVFARDQATMAWRLPTKSGSCEDSWVVVTVSRRARLEKRLRVLFGFCIYAVRQQPSMHKIHMLTIIVKKNFANIRGAYDV
jgi:hypothetical protein